MTLNARRRTLAELRTLYMLHPHLRDVFVEGREDVRLLRHHLGTTLESSARVTAIGDAVDVPNELLTSRGVDVGERGRLIVLSEFVESWRLRDPVATCIVDSDFEIFERDLPVRASLLATDYSSVEVYGLLPRPFGKFLSIVGASETDPQQVLNRLIDLWRTLFALRFVLHREYSVSLHDRYIRRCHLSGADVRIEVEEVVQISMQGRPATTHGEVVAAANGLRANLDTGLLQGIRGHDIAPVLIWYLRLAGDFRHEATIERFLLSCIETADLACQPMFAALAARVNS